MKKVSIVPLVMGLVIGGVAIKLGLNTLEEARASGQHEMVNVVVAVAAIDATAAIKPEMVRTIETPKTPLVGKGCFTDTKDLIGRVTAVSVARGSVIRESALTPPGTPAGLAVRIRKGYRAVSVKVNEVTGVAYQIQPGAFVDVIAVMSMNRGRKKETVSRIILQNVEVGAVGRQLNSSGETGGKSRATKSVTLLVRETEAPRLHLAQTRGKLTLALRSGEDDILSSNPGSASESDLLGQQRRRTPSSPSITHLPPHSVTVVNGGREREHEFGLDDPVDDAPSPAPRGPNPAWNDDDDDGIEPGSDDGSLPPG